jgi:hypothetical protein
VLSELQRVLLTACLQREPAPWLLAMLERGDLALTAAERELLAALGNSADGMRLTRLLVEKLRLERLLRGDPELAAAFVRDEAAFVARFRRYCDAVPPTAVFPSEEAAAFAAFERAAAH